MKQHTLEFVSCLDNLQLLDALLQRIEQQWSVNGDTLFQIQLCLTEAVTNAIRHGNQQDHSKFVQVHCIRDDRDIVVEVTDEGDGFDASVLPDPTALENIATPGGRGVFLIRNLCREVEYINGGNTVRMHFEVA